MIDVRIARPGDAKGIAEVHLRSWKSVYADDFSKEYLESLSLTEFESQWMHTIRSVNPFSTEKMVFVAEEPRTRRIVGFILVGSESDVDRESDSEIHHLHVLEEFRRQGIGSALFQAGMEWLQTKAFKRVHFWVINHKTPHEYLTKMGGRVVTENVPGEIGGNRVTKTCYRFNLRNWGKAGMLRMTRWIVLLGALPAGIVAEGITRALGLQPGMHGFSVEPDMVATIPSLIILPIFWLLLAFAASPRSTLGMDSYTFWRNGGIFTLILTYLSQIFIRTSAFLEYSDREILLFFYPTFLVAMWSLVGLYMFLIRLLFRRGLYE